VVARANSGATATSAIEALGQAHLALAWSAWLGDASRGVAATAAAAARVLPRPPLAQEDALAVLALRGALVASWVEAGDTKAAVEPLVEALTATPVVIDRASSTRRSSGRWPGVGARRRAPPRGSVARRALALVEAVEHSHDHARNGLLAAKGPTTTRSAGTTSGSRAGSHARRGSALTDRGDPDAALALIVRASPCSSSGASRSPAPAGRGAPRRGALPPYRGDARARKRRRRGARDRDRCSAAPARPSCSASRAATRRRRPGRPFFRTAPPHARRLEVLLTRSNLRATLAGDAGARRPTWRRRRRAAVDGGRGSTAPSTSRAAAARSDRDCLACVERFRRACTISPASTRCSAVPSRPPRSSPNISRGGA
jgi:hypothetical protein